MSLKAINFSAIASLLEEEKLPYGLYIVAIDIGNPADITIRALSVLKNVDLVICEERKAGSSTLKKYGIQKPIELLNEHNEREQSKELLNKLMRGEIAVALISDCGTPLFADPGNKLVSDCHYYKIPVHSVPGASSLTAALMISGLSDQQFIYYGFLPANKEERIGALKQVESSQHNLIFLETPYRLKALLSDIAAVLGKKRKGIIAYKLTQPEERVLKGTIDELIYEAQSFPKGEFVFILERRTDYGKKRERESKIIRNRANA